jgi:hypothetical protein
VLSLDPSQFLALYVRFEGSYWLILVILVESLANETSANAGILVNGRHDLSSQQPRFCRILRQSHTTGSDREVEVRCASGGKHEKGGKLIFSCLLREQAS